MGDESGFVRESGPVEVVVHKTLTPSNIDPRGRFGFLVSRVVHSIYHI